MEDCRDREMGEEYGICRTTNEGNELNMVNKLKGTRAKPQSQQSDRARLPDFEPHGL